MNVKNGMHYWVVQPHKAAARRVMRGTLAVSRTTVLIISVAVLSMLGSALPGWGIHNELRVIALLAALVVGWRATYKQCSRTGGWEAQPEPEVKPIVGRQAIVPGIAGLLVELVVLAVLATYASAR